MSQNQTCHPINECGARSVSGFGFRFSELVSAARGFEFNVQGSGFVLRLACNSGPRRSSLFCGRGNKGGVWVKFIILIRGGCVLGCCSWDLGPSPVR